MCLFTYINRTNTLGRLPKGKKEKEGRQKQ